MKRRQLPGGYTTIAHPEKSRQKFAKTYSAMTEGELEQLAGNAGELTGRAREALRQEIGRRGLTFPLREATAQPEPQWRRPVTLRVFGNLQQALLARSILDSASVRCFLADENMARLDSFMSTIVGGIKLWVNQEDAEAAATLLDAEIPGEFAVQGENVSRRPRCPHCESPGISFEELNRRAPYADILAKLTIPWKRRRWKCDSCGNEWQDAGG